MPSTQDTTSLNPIGAAHCPTGRCSPYSDMPISPSNSVSVTLALMFLSPEHIGTTFPRERVVSAPPLSSSLHKWKAQSKTTMSTSLSILRAPASLYWEHKPLSTESTSLSPLRAKGSLLKVLWEQCQIPEPTGSRIGCTLKAKWTQPITDDAQQNPSKQRVLQQGTRVPPKILKGMANQPFVALQSAHIKNAYGDFL